MTAISHAVIVIHSLSSSNPKLRIRGTRTEHNDFSVLAKQWTHARRAHKYESPLVTLQSCYVPVLGRHRAHGSEGREDYVCTRLLRFELSDLGT